METFEERMRRLKNGEVSTVKNTADQPSNSFEERMNRLKGSPSQTPSQVAQQEQKQAEPSFISKAKDYISSFFTPKTPTPTNVGGDVFNKLNQDIKQTETTTFNPKTVDRSTPIYDMASGTKSPVESAQLTDYGRQQTQQIADIQRQTVLNTVGGVAESAGSFVAGTGDVVQGTGQTLKWLGADGLGNSLIQKGGELQTFAPETPEFNTFDWKHLYNPRFYTTQVTRGIPFSVSMMPLAILGSSAGTGLGGMLGLGTLGRFILGTIGGGGLSAVSEAGFEAGSTYDESLNEGKSVEEANKSAQKTFIGNVELLTITNSLQFIPIFKALGNTEKVAQNTAKRSVIRTVAGKVGTLAGEMLSEGGEEVTQKNISLASQNKPFDFTSKETQMEFALGALQGLMFTAGGEIIERSTGKNVTKEVTNIGLEQSKQTIQEIKRNIVEQVPEVKIEIQKAVSKGVDVETATTQVIDKTIENTPRVIEKVIIDTIKGKVEEEKKVQETIKSRVSNLVTSIVENSTSPEMTVEKIKQVTDIAINSTGEGFTQKIKSLRAELSKQIITLVGGKSEKGFKADYAIIEKAKTDSTLAPVINGIQDQIKRLDNVITGKKVVDNVMAGQVKGETLGQVKNVTVEGTTSIPKPIVSEVAGKVVPQPTKEIVNTQTPSITTPQVEVSKPETKKVEKTTEVKLIKATETEKKQAVSKVEPLKKDEVKVKPEVNKKTESDTIKVNETTTVQPTGLSNTNEVPTTMGRTNGEQVDERTLHDTTPVSDKPRAGYVGDRSPVKVKTAGVGKVGRVEDNNKAIAILEDKGYATLQSKYTKEELEQLRLYSGAGGKAVAGAEGKGLLSEYYTPPEVTSKVWDLVNQFTSLNKNSIALEPSVGIGSLLEGKPAGVHFDSYEYQKVSGTIAQVLNPDIYVNIGNGFEFGNEGNFETSKDTNKYDLVVGNPPFGERASFLKGKGVDPKINRWEEFFIKRGLESLKDNGTLVYVVNSSFLNKSSTVAKEQISKLGELVQAVRLPEGIFADTSVGTDIVVFKKTPLLNNSIDERVRKLTNNNYFTDNPQNIAGTVETRRNRFGKEETFVAGTIEDVKRINTVSEVDEIVPIKTTEKPKLRKLVSESTTTKTIKEVREGAKKETLPVVIAPSKDDNIQTIKKQTIGGKKINSTEVRIFKNTNVDGSVEYKDDFKKYLNYYDGKYYHDVNYFSGDIYEKISKLKSEKEYIVSKIGEEQYKKQFDGLEEVKPTPVTIEDVTFDPLDRYITKVEIRSDYGETNILNDFNRFLDSGDAPMTYGVYRSDVKNYVSGRRASAGTKNKIGQIKADAKRLFNYYLKNKLDLSVQKQIIDKYNVEKNSYVNPDYSKIPVEIKDMAEFFRGKTFNLSATQASGVSFLNNKGVGLVAYGVGVGKTHTLIVSTMVANEKGWNKRPAFIVPKSTLTETWIGTIKSMFPNKTIVNLGGLNKPDVAKMEKLRGKNRSKWIKDGEITVITHEGLLRLALKPDEMSSAIDDLSDALSTSDEGKSARQKETEKSKIQEIVGKAQYKAGDINISDLGIDHISVDEVHNFRKIFQGAKPEVLNPDGTPDKSVSKRFGNVVGGTPSKQAQQLFLISQYILKNNDNRGVYLASATPFENHATEVYNILSLVARDRMRKMGIQNINDFFSLFSNFETEMDKNVQGEWVNKEKMKSFKNLPQLQKLLREFVDYQVDPTLVRPDRMVMTPHLQMSALQSENLDKIQAMLKPADNGVKPEDGAVLKASTYSVANSISPYFIKEYQPDIVTPEELIENSPKLKYSMELLNSLHNNKDVKDFGTFIYIGANGIDYHNHITDYAVNHLGFKPQEVAVINGSTSNDERERIKKGFNDGDIKLLVGGDPTKEGIDLQNNGYTTINVALGWNPTEVAQVEGRVWRQGNTRSIAPLVYPLVENSGDITIYNKFEEKGGRINDLFSYQGSIFDVGELDPKEKKLALMTSPEDKASIEIEIDKAEAQSKLMMLTTELSNLSNLLSEKNSKTENIDRIQKQLTDGKNSYGGELSDYSRTNLQDELKKLTPKLKNINAILERKGISDIPAKIVELEAERKVTEDQIIKIGSTYEARLTKFKSEYDDMLANRKSIGDHVNDFFNKTKDLKFLTKDEIENKKQRLIKELEAKKLKAPSGNADVGGYADIDIKDTQLKAIEFPELVSIVKELTGNAPSVKSFKDALGKMYAKSTGIIKLNPNIFKDEKLATKVLAHELGHLADYMPNLTVKRGNLIGRIASLNKFMKGQFGELNNREIKNELKKLTQIWKPFDENANKAFTDYRYSSKELYADAVSVLLNQPQMLKEQAPKFYDAFFEYLHSKPEFEKEYFDTIELLNKGQDAVNDKRLADMYEGFAEAKAKREAIEKKVEEPKPFIERLMRNHVTKFDPIYRKLGKVDIGQVESSKQQVREALETMQMRRNDQVLFLDKVVSDITEPLQKIGISEEDLGIVLKLERESMGDRVDLANPGGMIGKIPETVLTHFYETKKWTKEQMQVFDQVKNRFHEIVFDENQRAVNNGNFNKKIFEEKILPNKYTYATFSVVHYIHQNYITPAIKSQMGTTSTIENPFTSTIMKTMSLIDWNNVQESKQVVVAELSKHFAEDMVKAEEIKGSDGQVIKFKKDENREVLELMEDGHRIGYNIDPYIKAMFDSENITPDEMHSLVLISRGFNKIFKPLVTTYNLGWGFYSNIIRDVGRTYVHLGSALSKFAPESKSLTIRELLTSWIKSVPEGYKFASGQKDDLIREMLRNKAMGSNWSQYDPNANNDSSIAPLLRQYKVIGEEPVSKLTKVFNSSIGKVLNGIQFMGGVFDATSKVAGYQVAKRE